ncbi:MAG TPA: hypothetical protein VHY37_13335, partial [Tepidisphaeraceae bacterium]|nr:hypothetical protein [Tepidisphaeraceae bacterium]
MPTPDTVHKAVKIYLQIAYPDGILPPAAKAIVDKLTRWPGDSYDYPPFIHEGPDGANCYYLRLGNSSYPHMKLFIETWP